MHSFDFVCLGAGGGPSETDLSAYVDLWQQATCTTADLLPAASYLLKTADTHWEDGIIAVEAGSGIGALTTILSRTRDAFREVGDVPDIQESPEILASRIYSYIQCVEQFAFLL